MTWEEIAARGFTPPRREHLEFVAQEEQQAYPRASFKVTEVEMRWTEEPEELQAGDVLTVARGKEGALITFTKETGRDVGRFQTQPHGQYFPQLAQDGTLLLRWLPPIYERNEVGVRYNRGLEYHLRNQRVKVSSSPVCLVGVIPKEPYTGWWCVDLVASGYAIHKCSSSSIVKMSCNSAGLLICCIISE